MKRLTKIVKGKLVGVEWEDTEGTVFRQPPFNPRATEKIVNRLVELEDKLESGQLVELPCKIHDMLYTHKKVFGKWQIEELDCWGFHSDGRGILFINCQNARTASPNSLRSYTVEDFGKVVFADKTQAEVRLKELQ